MHQSLKGVAKEVIDFFVSLLHSTSDIAEDSARFKRPNELARKVRPLNYVDNSPSKKTIQPFIDQALELPEKLKTPRVEHFMYEEDDNSQLRETSNKQSGEFGSFFLCKNFCTTWLFKFTGVFFTQEL